MSITVEIYIVNDHAGRAVAFDARSVVLHSPREGLNNDVLRGLETDMDKLINERLQLALEKGGVA